MPKIVISYRRADLGVITGRIRDRLAQHYGDDCIFMDIDNIPYGVDFRKNIADALAKNDLLLAVIGPTGPALRQPDLAAFTTRTIPFESRSRLRCSAASRQFPCSLAAPACRKPRNCRTLSRAVVPQRGRGRFRPRLSRPYGSADPLYGCGAEGQILRPWSPFAFRRVSRRQAGIGIAGSMAVIAVVVFALFARDSGPVFIGSLVVIENQYLQFYGALPTVDVKQQLVQAIELVNNQQYDRALELFVKIPPEMRVPAVWNDLGVVFERLNDLTNARAAYQAALAKDPGLTLAKRNLARLENAAAPAARRSQRLPPPPTTSTCWRRRRAGNCCGAKRELAQITSGKEDDWIEIRTGD